MRADRLISILMLLQAHGMMTAAELAETLEVSERTIYRDVEALCASGVPLYAEHGPGGGLALLDSYRTNLTGLNNDELRALFMMFSVSGPLDKLGVNRELKSAILKLSASLSGGHRSEEEKVRQRFYLDWSWWFHTQEPVPNLAVIQRALWEDQRLRIRYRSFRLFPVEVEIEPYGLVAKAGVWFLVAGVSGGVRVYQISWLTDVEVLDETFTRPLDFDLAAFWQSWCAQYEQDQRAFLVTLRIGPDLAKLLPLYFGHRATDMVSGASIPDERGWIMVQLPFESFESARDRILGFGAAAEVMEPIALRYSVADYATQVVKLYEQRGLA